MSNNDISLSDLWFGALASTKAGLAIKTNDRKLLQQQLYRCRNELGDPSLEALMISVPDIDGELWIVKRDCLDAQDSR